MKISDDLKHILDAAGVIAKQKKDTEIDLVHLLAAVQSLTLLGVKTHKAFEKHVKETREIEKKFERN